jgi:hypothetical protein
MGWIRRDSKIPDSKIPGRWAMQKGPSEGVQKPKAGETLSDPKQSIGVLRHPVSDRACFGILRRSARSGRFAGK